MAIDEKKLRQIFGEQQEQTERYIGSLKEDFDHKLDAVFEYVKDIPTITQKQVIAGKKLERVEELQDVLVDKVGEIAEDITVIKETVKDHKVRFQKLEA